MRNQARAIRKREGRRIIIVVNTMEMGGAERQALMLARELRHSHGAIVAIWACSGGAGRLSQICDEEGISWRIVPALWLPGKRARLLQWLRFARSLRRARPNAILPFTTMPNTICGLTWRLSGAKTCLWNQRDEGLEHLPGRWGALVEKLAAHLSPCFVSNSQAGAAFLARQYGVEPNRIHIVPNGIEMPRDDAHHKREHHATEQRTSEQRAQWRKTLALDEKQFVACMIANLHGAKDHETLLRAWRIVLDCWHATANTSTASISANASSVQMSDAALPVLLLAGRADNLGEALQNLAGELALGQSVRFLGAVADVGSLLSAIDLGVLSSRSEGCPNAVLETMAAGLAVTGTDVAGIRNALGENTRPFLAPPGDAHALAQQILRLAHDDTLRTRLGSANRLRIQHHFDPRRMGQTMMNLTRKCPPSTKRKRIGK